MELNRRDVTAIAQMLAAAGKSAGRYVSIERQAELSLWFATQAERLEEGARLELVERRGPSVDRLSAACTIAPGLTLTLTVDGDPHIEPVKDLFDVVVDAGMTWIETHPPVDVPRPARTCPSSKCRTHGLPTTRAVCNVCGTETVEKT